MSCTYWSGPCQCQEECARLGCRDVRGVRAVAERTQAAVADAKPFPYPDLLHKALEMEFAAQQAEAAPVEPTPGAPSEPVGMREAPLLDEIARYWMLAHAEGKEGRDHDTEAGDAAECWHRIRELIRALASEPAPAADERRDAERYRWLTEGAGRMEFGRQPGDADKPPKLEWRWFVDFTKAEADAYIDAALAARSAPGEKP